MKMIYKKIEYKKLDEEKIKEELKKLHKEEGISYKKIAEKLKVKQQTVTNWTKTGRMQTNKMIKFIDWMQEKQKK